MSITFASSGSGVSTQTAGAALSPLNPAVVTAGQILLAHVTCEGVVFGPTTPSGWTLLRGPDAIETTVANHWVFGRIADGTEDGAAVAFGTFGGISTDQRAARIYSFNGRISGSITDLVVGFAVTSHATDPQMPSVTTTVAGSLAVAFVYQNDNNALAAATGESGGDWVEAVAEYSANLTPGLVLQLQTAAMASIGTISGGAVAATNDPSGVIAFEIRDSVPAEAHSGTASLSGGGSLTTVITTARNAAPALTGGGSIATVINTQRSLAALLSAGGGISFSAATQRSLAALLSAGGGITTTGEAAAGAENHDGSASLSAGGSIVYASATQRLLAATLVSGGSIVYASATQRSLAALLSAGGGISFSAATQRSLAALLSAGGAIAVTEQSNRTVITSLVSGGSIALSNQTARNLIAALVGGGIITASGSAAEAGNDREGVASLSAGGGISITAATQRFIATQLQSGGGLTVVFTIPMKPMKASVTAGLIASAVSVSGKAVSSGVIASASSKILHRVTN